MGSPHDVPSAAALVEAVREWIESQVAQAPGLAFHARVAANVLAMVERELALGAAQAAAHAGRLASLGAVDDADLAARIRGGEYDDRIDDVRRLVRESVRDKLLVANPKYLDS